MNISLIMNHLNLVCIMYAFYVLNDLSLKFHIKYLACLAGYLSLLTYIMCR